MFADFQHEFKKNTDLVTVVHKKWLAIAACYIVQFMHAKGHSGIHGNLRAEIMAAKGATSEMDEYMYRDIAG